LGWINQVLDEDPNLYKHDFHPQVSYAPSTRLRDSRRYIVLLTWSRQ